LSKNDYVKFHESVGRAANGKFKSSQAAVKVIAVPVQLVEHCLHLAERMAVAAARRAADAGLQPLDGLRRAPAAASVCAAMK
jgi:hypothetical protein